MKICLINPPITGVKGEFYEYEANLNAFPHLGLGYVAAALEKKGFQVDVIECQGQNISNREAVKKVYSEKYDIIGISSYFYNVQNVMRIVEGIKIKMPSVFVFAGGYLPTLTPEVVLNMCPSLDCCVVGEGEITCVELADAIRTGMDIGGIKGIAFKRDGEITHTPYRKYIENLDDLPFPKRSFVSEKLKMIGLLTSRGCYGRCIFCGQNEFYEKCLSDKVRYRSPENVVNELVYLKKNYDFDKIFIHDDNFIDGSRKRKDWLNRFYNLLKMEGLSFSYIRIDARANDIIACRDILKKLKEIGLTNIFVGIESFSQRQLDFFNKATTKEQNIEAMKIIAELGLKLEFGFLALEPFVTMEELLENCEILESTGYYNFTSANQDLLSLGTRRLKAVPGTKVHTLLDNMGLITPTDYFYEFKDARVELFFNVLILWGERVGKYLPLFYLMNKAEYFKKYDIEDLLEKEFYSLQKLDIQFVIELCHKVLDQEIVETKDSLSFLNKWEEASNPIFTKLIYAKEEMAKYT
jgi:anaerobic magnesium-protoporphyrin IX monomethyl ester cyclase